MNIQAILNHDSESRPLKLDFPSMTGNIDIPRYEYGTRSLDDVSYLWQAGRSTQPEPTPRTQSFTPMCQFRPSAVNDRMNNAPEGSQADLKSYKSIEHPILVPQSSFLPIRPPVNIASAGNLPTIHNAANYQPRSADLAASTEESKIRGTSRTGGHHTTAKMPAFSPLNAQTSPEQSSAKVYCSRQSSVDGPREPLTPASSNDVMEDVHEEDPGPTTTKTLCREDGGTGYRCFFMSDCILESPERKTISHFFGRNKACTQAIPPEVWVPYCRRHYQRSRYRNITKFANVQLELIRIVVNNFEAWGGVENFEVILRKRAAQAMAREDKFNRDIKASGRRESSGGQSASWKERWLVPYLGKNKSFQDVYKILDRIDDFAKEHNLENPPEFEILPCYKPGWIKDRELPKTSVAQAAKPTGIAKRSASNNGRSLHRPSVSSPPSLTPVPASRFGRGSISSGRSVGISTRGLFRGRAASNIF